jgi:hypothetical protein
VVHAEVVTIERTEVIPLEFAATYPSAPLGSFTSLIWITGLKLIEQGVELKAAETEAHSTTRTNRGHLWEC